MSTMRRESVATDPLAQISAQQQIPPPPHVNQPSVERADSGVTLPPRAVSSPSMSPDESAEKMMISFASKCRKMPLDPSTVPATLDGLQVLARSHAWRHVVELSSRVADSRADCPISLGTKLRLEGLFRLKMFDDLSFEATNLLSALRTRILRDVDSDEAVRSSNNINAMRLLISEVKTMTGNGEDAFQDMFQLRDELEKQTALDPLSAVSPSLWWTWRVTSSIINAAIRQRLWRMALGELLGFLTSLRTKHKSMADTLYSSSSKESVKGFRRVEIIVLCRLSRILLQIGAIKSSLLYFNEASEALQVLAKEAEYVQRTSDVYSQVELTRGLMLFGQDKYEEATEVFLRIINAESKQRVSSASDTHSIFDAGPVDGPSLFWKEDSGSAEDYSFDTMILLESSILTAAVNNYSICALYLRHMRDAIDRLEELIKDDPLCHLVDPIVFNLCTLYDMSCSPDVSVIKKMVLQKLSVKYHVDDPLLHWRSFGLN